MSLQVWLPLNDDLRNQGLYNTVFTNYNAIIENNGKIGKCYSFDGSSSYLIADFTPGTIVPNEMSFCCWVKLNEINKTHTLFSSRKITGAGLSIFILSSNKLRFDNGNDQSNSTNQVTFNYNFVANIWYHIAVIQTNTQRKLYINGVLQQSVNKASANLGNNSATKCTIGASGANDATGNWLDGYLNDVRVYNHALSDKEIEEINKGLILHYKLNENINILDNCFSYPTFNTTNANGGWSHWGKSGASGTQGQNTDKKYIYNKNNAYSHWWSNAASATREYLLYQSPAFEGGYRSLQGIFKEENGLPITESIIFPAWNSRDGGAPSGIWTDIISLGDGFYLCKCEGIHQDGTNDLIGFCIKPGYKVYCSEAYVENNREICSDIFNFNNNIAHDSSGYNNNGTIGGSLSTVTDSARYNYATYFNGTDSLINTNNRFDFLNESPFTISIWIHCDDWAAVNAEKACYIISHYNASRGGFRMYSVSGANRYRIYWLDTSGTARAIYFSPAGALTTGWHLFTATYDGTTMRTYLDGIYYTQTTQSFKSSSAPNLQIGVGSSGLQGNYSDFRIYVTALTSDQVKELYNTSATIDNLGNAYARELVE